MLAPVLFLLVIVTLKKELANPCFIFAGDVKAEKEIPQDLGAAEGCTARWDRPLSHDNCHSPAQNLDQVSSRPPHCAPEVEDLRAIITQDVQSSRHCQMVAKTAGEVLTRLHTGQSRTQTETCLPLYELPVTPLLKFCEQT